MCVHAISHLQYTYSVTDLFYYGICWSHTLPCIRSESPSQVFLIIIQWLLSVHKSNSSSQEKSSIYLAYDNVCNLAKLKVAQSPLPFPSPLIKFGWTWTTCFTLKNIFLPNAIKSFLLQKWRMNITQDGEQTFVWVHRFSHILCSMNKIHHLFYLHRMVIRRNEYTSKCYVNGKKTLLPKGDSRLWHYCVYIYDMCMPVCYNNIATIVSTFSFDYY